MPSEEDEYADEIFERQREAEVCYLIKSLVVIGSNNEVKIRLAPDATDVELQIELRAYRELLVGWLIEVYDQYFCQYGTPTIFLIHNIIDRFLSRRRVQIDELQLVCITALHMALKFETGVRVKLSDLEDICDNKCTSDQIARAERCVLRALDYRLAWPGPLPFLERISRSSPESSLTKKAAEYILEATAANYACVSMLPSLIAATSFCLAQSLLGSCNWTPEQEEYSGYRYSQVYPHMKEFLHWMQTSEHLYKVAYRKYSASKCRRVATLIANQLKEGLKIGPDSPRRKMPCIPAGLRCCFNF